MKNWLYFFLFAPSGWLSAQPSCSVSLTDVTVCNDAVFRLVPQLTGSDNVSSFFWSGGLGLSCYNCSAPTVSGLSTGTYAFVLTVRWADGCLASDSVVITVVEGQAPSYHLAAPQGLCKGDTAHLGGPAFAGNIYQWSSLPPGFSSAEANPAVSPDQNTVYYLLVSNTSCPLPTLDSTVVWVSDYRPTFSPAEDTLRLCRGSSVEIGAETQSSGTFTWEPQTGLTLLNNGRRAVVAPANATFYTLTATDGICSRRKMYYLALDSLPHNLSILPKDTTICFGDSALLRTSPYEADRFPGLVFRWSRTPPTTWLTPDSLADVLVRPEQTTTYRRIAQSGLCSDTAVATVEVVPPVTMSAEPYQSSICPGDSVLIRLSYPPGVSNVSWEPAAGLSCATCDSAWARPPSSTLYVVRGAYQGCPLQASATVEVRPLATLSLPSSPLPVCHGDSVLLNGAFDADAHYLWTSTHPGFDTLRTPSPVVRPVQTATYYVTADNGCIRRDSVQVVVQRAALEVSNDTGVCKGQSVRLIALTDTPGGLFEWKRLPDEVVLSTAQSVLVGPDSTTAYVITLRYGQGCRKRDTVVVTVKGEGLYVLFPDDPRLCPGEPVTLNLAPPNPAAQYTWTASPPDPNLATQSPAPVVSPAQNTTYTVTVREGECVLTRSFQTVVFSATLRASADTTICAGDRIVLSAAGVGPNGRYLWNGGETTALIQVAPDTPAVFVVTYFFGDTCALRDTVRVNTAPAFSLDISHVPDTLNLVLGQSLQLFATVSPPQNLDGFSFTWQETVIDPKTLPFTGANIEVRPSSNDTASAAIRYTLRAVSPQGCVRIAEKTFRLLFPKVRFPNAFSPDGDGHNDFFEMLVLEGQATLERLRIFNRWGGLIFESAEPNARWDGTVGGRPAPSDVYLYYVEWRRSDGIRMPPVVGDVTLMR